MPEWKKENSKKWKERENYLMRANKIRKDKFRRRNILSLITRENVTLNNFYEDKLQVANISMDLW